MKNNIPDVMKTKLKCPKCKSNTLTIMEWINCASEHYQENGIIMGTTNDPDGNYHKLTAICDMCNHKWTVRNAKQIWDIIIRGDE